MRILERRFTFIHTHFLTDCEKLPTEVGREIQRKMERYLRARGIVYGIHFEERRTEKGLRIVLECIPLPRDLEEIEKHLKELVRPVPRRPKPVFPVAVEPPPHRRAEQPGEKRAEGSRADTSDYSAVSSCGT